MTGEILLVLAIVAITMLLWILEIWPVDLVALCIPVALVLLGVLGPTEAFAGFSSTAVVTIAGIFVVSGGLVRTGAVAYIGDRIIHHARGDERRLLLLVMVTMTVVSAFINNTAVVAMFLPVILGVSEEFGVAPSKLLMPLSFASILGGTCSLIGTSTNLLVHGLMLDAGMDGLGMFEITPVGLMYGALGIAYLYFVGSRLLPERGSFSSYLGAQRGATEYMTEVRVSSDSVLIGRTLRDSLAAAHPEVRVLQVVRGEQVIWAPFGDTVFEEADILRLKGDVNQLLGFYREPGIELLPGLPAEPSRLEVKGMNLAELVVMPNSPLVGRNLKQIQFRRRYGVSAIALQRHGEHMREGIADLRLQVGDVLLVIGDADDVRALLGLGDFLVLEGVQRIVVHKDKAPIALAIIAALIAVASFEVVPVMVAVVVAALAMVLSGCLPFREAYRSIDVSVLMLIGGAMALGTAMDSSGAAGWLGDRVVEGIGAFGPYAMLAAIYLLTTLLTEVMTNNAAAVLMVPLAISVAAGMGIDPRPLVIAVAFAGSASFMTPVGYQTNTLVYGPGGYRFADFTRVGLPLNVLLWGAATLLIPIWWPF